MKEITVGDLSTKHVGQRLTIATPEATITGMLRAIRSDTEWITLSRLCKEPGIEDQYVGARTTTITIGRWTTDDMPLDAAVTLEEA